MTAFHQLFPLMRKPFLNASLACVVQVALWAGLPSTASAGPIRIDYTGSFTSYNVMTTGTYQIFAFGAQGATVGIPGGLGAEIAGDIALTAGQVLTIAVGGQGMLQGGGGGTFVVSGLTPLFIAGGGGGASGVPGTGSAGQSGMSGASPTGGNNLDGGAGGTGGRGGSARSQGNGTGGGGGGFLTDGGSNTQGQGGTGGASYLNGLGGGLGAIGTVEGGFGGGGGGGFFNSGGGGGGYSGGGGGFFGNGGGGGSYNAGMINSDLISLDGVNAGDGFATLELLTPVAATVPAPATISLLGLGLAGVGLFSRRRVRNTV